MRGKTRIVLLHRGIHNWHDADDLLEGFAEKFAMSSRITAFPHSKTIKGWVSMTGHGSIITYNWVWYTPQTIDDILSILKFYLYSDLLHFGRFTKCSSPSPSFTNYVEVHFSFTHSPFPLGKPNEWHSSCSTYWESHFPIISHHVISLSTKHIGSYI